MNFHYILGIGSELFFEICFLIGILENCGTVHFQGVIMCLPLGFRMTP